MEDKQQSAQRRSASRFSMPLTALGDKSYYLGIFFKVKMVQQLINTINEILYILYFNLIDRTVMFLQISLRCSFVFT